MAIAPGSYSFMGGTVLGKGSEGQFVLVRSGDILTTFTSDEYSACVEAVNDGKAVCVQYKSGSARMQAQLAAMLANGTLLFSHTTVDTETIYIVAGSNPHSITAHTNSLGGGGTSYSAGAGINISSGTISANFVSSAPKSAISSSTFPAVNNGQYTITSEDLQGCFIHLRLADIRPADAMQAGIGCTFQIFIKGMRFYRQGLQTMVTVGNRFTCEFEWVLAEIATPSLWLNADPIEDVEFAWKSQEMTAYRSLAFACDDNGADWVTNAPHLAIYLPPELRSELQADDILEIAGEVYVRPGKDRLSLV